MQDDFNNPTVNTQFKALDSNHPAFDPSKGGFSRAASYGVFVGISSFEERTGFSPLPYAVNDAISLAYLFVMQLGLIPPKNCTLAISGVPDPSVIGELQMLIEAGVRQRAADCKTILEAIASTFTDTDTTDGMLVMTVSTHAVLVGSEGILVPSDANSKRISKEGIEIREIRDALDSSQAERKILLLDTCQESTRGEVGMPEELHKALSISSGLAVLLACSEGQRSFEDEKLRHGVFTAHFIHGALGKAAPASADGLVLLSDVLQYASTATTDWVKRNKSGSLQTPCFRGQVVALDIPLAVNSDMERNALAKRESLKARQEQVFQLGLEFVRKLEPNQLVLSKNELLTVIEGISNLDTLAEFEEELKLALGKQLRVGASVYRFRRFNRFYQQFRGQTTAAVAPPSQSLFNDYRNLLGNLFVVVPEKPTLLSTRLVTMRDVRSFSKFLADLGERTVSKYRHFILWCNRMLNCSDEDYLPATDVSYHAATEFALLLTAVEWKRGALDKSKMYRLPTHEEWLYCAALDAETQIREFAGVKWDHNGIAEMYPWGIHWPPNAGFGNLANSTEYTGRSPVAAYPASRSGAYDLTGNVWELTSSLIAGDKAKLRLDDGVDSDCPIIVGGSYEDGDKNLLRCGMIEFRTESGSPLKITTISPVQDIVCVDCDTENDRIGFRLALADANGRNV